MLLSKTKARELNRRFWAFMSDEDDTVESGTGGTPIPEAASTVDWTQVIPADLQTKEYFKNILGAEDPGAELIKQFDNAQGLLGRPKIGVPGADATDEQWAEFYTKSRPEDVNGYELGVPDVGDNAELQAALSELYTDDRVGAIKSIMHEFGISKKQAEGAWAKIVELDSAVVTEHLKAKQAADAQFESLLKQSFGGSREKAVDYGRDFLSKYGGPHKELMAGLPNEALILVAEMGKNVHAKFEAEDSTLGSTNKVTAGTAEGIRAEIDRLKALPEANDVMHKDYEATRAKINAEYKALVEAQNKK